MGIFHNSIFLICLVAGLIFRQKYYALNLSVEDNLPGSSEIHCELSSGGNTLIVYSNEILKKRLMAGEEFGAAYESQ